MKTSFISVRLVFLVSFALACMVAVRAVPAAPPILIEFEDEPSSGSEWIRANANCHTSEARLFEALNAVETYPALHGWIKNTTLERQTAGNSRQLLVEFRFPWPVGRQWSRVEVVREGRSSIAWYQVDGSLQLNRGRITINEVEGQAHLDYRASLDVGYPDAVTRSYKKQFVTEFLRAVYDATRSPGASSLPATTGDSHVAIAKLEEQ